MHADYVTRLIKSLGIAGDPGARSQVDSASITVAQHLTKPQRPTGCCLHIYRGQNVQYILIIPVPLHRAEALLPDTRRLGQKQNQKEQGETFKGLKPKPFGR